MAPKKSKKEKPKKPWESFPPEKYSEEISRLAHFSAKTVNSNTPAFGVRIGVNDRIDIPYVAVSSMDMSAIGLDYQKNAGKLATIVAQVSAVVEDGLQDYDDPPRQDIDMIKTAAQTLKQRYATPLSLVGMRLRQVIIQDENGEDISLTPLHSAGFSKELERRLEVELEIEKKLDTKNKRRARGFIEVGGANPQNVGRHTRAMRDPLWFNAPHEDKDIRKAFAIHYRGVSIKIPQGQLAELLEWRHSLLVRHLGKIPSNQKIRDKEKDFLVAMVHTVISRGDQANSLLNKHLDKLPNGEITSKAMTPCLRGLLDPDLRYRGWKREFAKKLHLEIIDSKVWSNGELRPLNISQEDSDRWISIIEEEL